MGAYNDTERAMMRVPSTDEEVRTARDDKARANVKAFASYEPDPAGWEADILAYLGLGQPARRAPAQLGEPGGSNTTRPAQKARGEHGHRKRYELGCRCVECREAQAEYRRELQRRRHDKAQAARDGAS